VTETVPGVRSAAAGRGSPPALSMRRTCPPPLLVLHPPLPPTPTSARPPASQPAGAAPRLRVSVVRAAAENGQFAFEEGATVKVTAPIKVFHVPKNPEVQLEGMVGTVKKIAALHKGALMSATMQYRVQFTEPVKFFAHLVGLGF
jgi:hypothetical protein